MVRDGLSPSLTFAAGSLQVECRLDNRKDAGPWDNFGGWAVPDTVGCQAMSDLQRIDRRSQDGTRRQAARCTETRPRLRSSGASQFEVVSAKQLFFYKCTNDQKDVKPFLTDDPPEPRQV